MSIEDTAMNVCCPKCSGTGRLRLQTEFPQLDEIMDLLHAHGPLTAPEILPLVKRKVRPSAINNRLENLRRSGFVTREKDGRQWRYSIKQPESTPSEVERRAIRFASEFGASIKRISAANAKRMDEASSKIRQL